MTAGKYLSGPDCGSPDCYLGPAYDSEDPEHYDGKGFDQNIVDLILAVGTSGSCTDPNDAVYRNDLDGTVLFKCDSQGNFDIMRSEILSGTNGYHLYGGDQHRLLRAEIFQ